MSKPIERALRRVCPDCGETAYGYPTGKGRMLWHCRDTGEQIGCGFRATSGPKFSADYIQAYRQREAALVTEEQEQDDDHGDDTERDTSQPDAPGTAPGATDKQQPEQYVSPITG